MFRTKMTIAVSVLAAMFLFGCAATQSPPSFVPMDLTDQARQGRYEKNVDNFLVILDASFSMSKPYQEVAKVEIAKQIADGMNRTIPDLGFVGGLRTFGQAKSNNVLKTDRLYGMAPHNKNNFSAAVAGIDWAGGLSPLGHAKKAVVEDLSGVDGKTALILISDAEEMKPDGPLGAAVELKNRFGDDLCIYTVHVGDDAGGADLMRRLAEAGGCGFSVAAGDIDSPDAMAGFVKKVFLKAGGPMDSDGDGVYDADDRCPGTPAGVPVNGVGCPKDSDGDGVFDYQDRCPGTPAGVAVNIFGCPLDSDADGVPDYQDQCPDTPRWTDVDARGCPLDSDGDGVTDDKDRCPGTPGGAKVDIHGCWVLSGVLFDTGKWDIKPAMAAELNQVVQVLRRNPGLKIQIQGHTDSVGKAAFNKSLSEKRARSVMNYLAGKGISPKRLTAKGFGESRPISTNDTAEGRATNRRVELKPMP